MYSVGGLALQDSLRGYTRMYRVGGLGLQDNLSGLAFGVDRRGDIEGTAILSWV